MDPEAVIREVQDEMQERETVEQRYHRRKFNLFLAWWGVFGLVTSLWAIGVAAGVLIHIWRVWVL